MAMHWCGDSFTPEQKAKAFEYYEAITVRDSSLSACSQAVMAAEVGHLDLAHDYLTEAALMDLRDLARNTRDGVHVASLAGTWFALVAGFGGLRDHDGKLTFAPRLPSTLQRLRFAVRWRGTKVRVEITADQATYSLEDGADTRLELAHHGEAFVLTTDVAGRPLDRAARAVDAATHPAGRPCADQSPVPRIDPAVDAAVDRRHPVAAGASSVCPVLRTDLVTDRLRPPLSPYPGVTFPGVVSPLDNPDRRGSTHEVDRWLKLPHSRH